MASTYLLARHSQVTRGGALAATPTATAITVAVGNFEAIYVL
jgi:hypothetical protein